MFHKSTAFRSPRLVCSTLVLAALFFRSASLLAATGDVDLSFDPGSGPNADVYCVAALPDGKALIGGAFTSINGTNRNRIARLNNDGSLDLTFDPGQGANDLVIALASLPDGKLLIGGSFTAVNGVDRSKLARLNPDGSVDATFDTAAFLANDVYSMAVQADGKVLVAGLFSAVYRFNQDGSFDEGFNSGVGANNAVYALGLQSDGKVLVAGAFSTFDGQPRSRIARLNDNGGLDGSFFPGTGPNSDVKCLTVQPDDKALIGGAFTLYDGRSRNHLARLNTDGGPDGTFYALGGANSSVLSIALERSGGKALIAGGFTSYGATPRVRIARLKSDGTLDATFDPGSGADALVRSVAEYNDGKVLIGGTFLNVGGVSRPHIARLIGDPILTISPLPPNIILSWPTNWSTYVLQSTTNLQPPVTWTDWTNGIVTNGGDYTLTNSAAGPARFYRLKK